MPNSAAPANPPDPAPETAARDLPPVVVKKYANRRLYNTETSAYITLDSLAAMVREGRDFVVYDAKTGEDITRGVLTQIIVDEEGRGRALLPTAFLRQLIGFYGDQMQGLVPKYLEQAMANFAQQHAGLREAVQHSMEQAMSGFDPFGLQQMGRQNVAMMERAMSLFAPFAGAEGGVPPMPAEAAAPSEEAALRAEIEALRRELAAAHARSGGKPAK